MQVVIVGIGGQGILFTTKVLGKIALDKGQHVMGSEVHGMAQRGGSVISHFKTGDFHSPLVRSGDGDVLLAFDQSEGIRNLSFLREGGSFVVNVHSRQALENGHLLKYLEERKIRMHPVGGYALLKEHMEGNFLFLNVLMLGAMCGSGVLGMPFEEVAAAVKSLSPERFGEANGRAFRLGFEAISGRK